MKQLIQDGFGASKKWIKTTQGYKSYKQCKENLQTMQLDE